MDIRQVKPEMDPLASALDRVGFTPLGFAALILLFLVPIFPGLGSEYMVRWLTVAAFVGAGSIAFDFASGYINIVNFGFMAFAGVGGYTSAILAVNHGVSPWLCMGCGMVSAGIFGLFTGIITLRLRGIFATCLTWFVGLALMGLTTKMVWLTRGPLGLRAPKLFETTSNAPYFYTILVILTLFYICCRLLVRGKMGLAFKAIGQNMEAARTSGINPVLYRLLNFVISCAMAGLLGGFYAHYFGILTPDVMHTSKTVEILAISYIGGRGCLWGGAAAAFPFLVLMESLRSTLSNYPGINLIIYGVMLVLVMIYFPNGLAGIFELWKARFKDNSLVQYLTSTRPPAGK